MIKFPLKVLFSLFLFIGGCAIVFPVKIGVTKNPFPIATENESSLRSLRSIAVAPFLDGKSISDGWAEEAVQLLEGRRIYLEGPAMVKIFFTRIKRSMEQIPDEERTKFAQRIGKALKTDGVIIGIITPLGKEDNRRVTIELIQISTGKILWWQAIDIAVKKGLWEPSREKMIRRVVPELLGSLPDLIGTSEKIEKPEKIERPEPKKPAIDISPM